MILTAKSKTFLIGEYSVLFGGSAVLLLTPPEFKLKTKQSEGALIGIGENSPAYKFYITHRNIFQNLSIEFTDPYNESGGLGASSAQFSLLYKLYLEKTKKKFDVKCMLDEYRELANNGRIKPSGADVVAQYYNEHIFFNSSNNSSEIIKWNFSDIDFAIFKTPFKVATHLHLQELKKMDVSSLEDCTQNVRDSFKSKNPRLLIANVQKFFEILKSMRLVLEETSYIVQELLKVEGLCAAKGCGAMSADTVVVIFEKQKRNNVLDKAQHLGLKVIVS